MLESWTGVKRVMGSGANRTTRRAIPSLFFRRISGHSVRRRHALVGQRRGQGVVKWMGRVPVHVASSILVDRHLVILMHDRLKMDFLRRRLS